VVLHYCFLVLFSCLYLVANLSRDEEKAANAGHEQAREGGVKLPLLLHYGRHGRRTREERCQSESGREYGLKTRP
jgi:hypothetical protein